jgi:tetratricopeptide (TPR) repeat protein
MPQIEFQPAPKHHPWIISGVSILILGLICTYILLIRVHGNGVQTDDNAYNGVVTRENLLASESKFGQGANLWMSYAASSPSKAHKNAAYINAASLYLNNNQNQDALNACQQAEKVSGVTYDEAEDAATAAQNLGQNSLAIHYYQKAITLIPASNSEPVTQKNIFNLDIHQLQGKT